METQKEITGKDDTIGWQTQDAETILDSHWYLPALRKYELVPKELRLNDATVLEMGGHPWMLIHFDTETPGLLSYISDYTRGKRVKVKPGRLIRKLNPEWTDDQVRLHTATVVAIDRRVGGLVIWTDPDECHEVYRSMEEEGIQSCMSHHPGDYESYEHPMMPLFGSPDIGVATLSEGGKLTSRALVNLKTRKFPSAYGNQVLLKKILEKNGFAHGALDGASFTTVVEEGRLVMPSIDGKKRIGTFDAVGGAQAYSLVEEGGEVVVTLALCGPYIANSTNGFAPQPLEALGLVHLVISRCEGCGEKEETQGELIRVDGDKEVCKWCVNAHYVAVCTGPGKFILIHITRKGWVQVEGIDYYDQSSAERCGWVTRGATQEWVRKSDANFVVGRGWLLDEDMEGLFEFVGTYGCREWGSASQLSSIHNRYAVSLIAPTKGNFTSYDRGKQFGFGEVSLYELLRKVGRGKESLSILPGSLTKLWVELEKSGLSRKFLPEETCGDGEVPAPAVYNAQATSIVNQILSGAVA